MFCCWLALLCCVLTKSEKYVINIMAVCLPIFYLWSVHNADNKPKINFIVVVIVAHNATKMGALLGLWIYCNSNNSLLIGHMCARWMDGWVEWEKGEDYDACKTDQSFFRQQQIICNICNYWNSTWWKISSYPHISHN